MHKVKIKICGLKSVPDVQACVHLGVDIVGFVVDYPIPVPWNLSAIEAAELLPIANAPCKTCVVTGGDTDKIISLATSLKPDFVQLHYNEKLEDTLEIAKELNPLGIQVIKTMPISDEDRMRQFGNTCPEKIVEDLCNTDIFAILVDARTPANVNESKHETNIELFDKVQSLSSKPVILAGGITPENARKVLKQTGAEYIDVMTGVEYSPGVKDATKLERLISEIKAI